MSAASQTEQMDAEGLGPKLLLTPSGDPQKFPKKQTVGTVTASHKMLIPCKHKTGLFRSLLFSFQGIPFSFERISLLSQGF